MNIRFYSDDQSHDLFKKISHQAKYDYIHLAIDMSNDPIHEKQYLRLLGEIEMDCRDGILSHLYDEEVWKKLLREKVYDLTGIKLKGDFGTPYLENQLKAA